MVDAAHIGPNGAFQASPGQSAQPGYATTTGPAAPSPRRSPARVAISQGFNPFWEDAPEQWDKVTLQGVQLPGIATVEHVLGRKQDVQSPPGSDGANIRDKGYEPARITITLRLWTRDDFNALDQSNLAAILQAGRQRVPLSIVHPVLNQDGIRQVIFSSKTGLKPSAMKGMWEVQLTFYQHKPPTPAPAQGAGSQATGSVGNRSSFGQTPAEQAAAAQAANDPSSPTATNNWVGPKVGGIVQGTLGHP